MLAASSDFHVVADSSFASGFLGAGFDVGTGSACIHSPDRNHASSPNTQPVFCVGLSPCLTIVYIFIKGVCIAV